MANMVVSLATALLLIGLAGPAFGSVLFSSLPRTLVVTASPKEGQVLMAGEDKLTVTWGPNKTLTAGADRGYSKVKLKLCYAPESQKDRGWRKTVDDLKKDKTCSFEITVEPYSGGGASFEYTVKKDIPSATYFIRGYVLDAGGVEVAYGQTTDGQKKTNLFVIKGITGRHASLDIASALFSAFSLVALAVFFVVEKSKQK